MNIVLIGMRGSGKTTVGKTLAKKLERQFIEMDEMVVEKAAMTIPEIVEKHGWEHFRDLESEITKEVAMVDNAVIATGGGVVVRPQNIETLKTNGILIYLKAEVDVLVSRIGKDPNRPALTKKKSLRDELTQVLQVRRSLYERAADKIIETNSMSPEETANAIIPEVTNLLHLGGDLYLTPREKQYLIDGKTRVCCVIGNPIEHSLSPAMHNAAYEKIGLNFAYVAFRVENVGNAVVGMETLGIRGMSVTIPHKVSIMKHLDRIDPLAKNIGAVNTVVNESGKLIGYNTDCEGAMRALKEITDIRGKSVVLIGAGGAARAIAFGLKQEGALLTILNRTKSRAEQLARELGSAFGDLSMLSSVKNAAILINATATGMSPNTNESLIHKELLRSEMVVFDIVYHPHETKLIHDAKGVGASVVYGYKMLLYQAVAQFELFTNAKATSDVVSAMENALVDHLERRKV